MDYTCNLVGQRNRLLVELETATNLPRAGGFLIDAPIGFLFDEKCVVYSGRRAQLPGTICTAAMLMTNNRFQVEITALAVVVADHYELWIDATNPTAPFVKRDMV